jgi:ATP-binding protein involved in chromosome partitioning
MSVLDRKEPVIFLSERMNQHMKKESIGSEKQNQDQKHQKQDAKIREQSTSFPTLPPALEEKSPQIASPEEKLIVAVPVAEGKNCAHFGHCEQFAFMGTENGKIVSKTMHTPPPHEPGVLPKWLHDMGVHIVIAGGMGSRARQILIEKGIRVISGAPLDSPESLVQRYLMDALVTGENVCDH